MDKTKYSDLEVHSAESVASALRLVIQIKSNENLGHEHFFAKIMLLANGAGIGLILTSLINVNSDVAQVDLGTIERAAFWFAMGLVLTGVSFVPVVVVTSQAVDFHFKQLMNFLQDKLAIEDMDSWGLSARGKSIYVVCFIGSIASFFYGVYLSFDAVVPS